MGSGSGHSEGGGSGVSGKRIDTRLIKGGRRREWTHPVVNPPVWRASTILFDSVAEMEAAWPPEDGRPQ